MEKFIISRRLDGDFQFNLKTDYNETILTSEGYSSKSHCYHGIESVKRNAPDGNKYDRKISTNGKFYFLLEAANGATIGVSQMYESEVSRDKGLESVQTTAPH